MNHTVNPALPHPDQEPRDNKYNAKRIAWELERTAMGDSYYGNALYVAMDMPQTTKNDRDMLSRYMYGSNLKTDHVKLQDLAMRIYTSPPAAQPAPKQQPVNRTAQQIVEQTEELAGFLTNEGTKAPVQQEAAALFREAMAFGLAYGPRIPGHQWDEMREEKVAQLVSRLATPHPENQPPPWWPAVENILNEYGLLAIDFVADFKKAQKEWVNLSDDEISEIAINTLPKVHELARALEAKIKEKNA